MLFLQLLHLSLLSGLAGYTPDAEPDNVPDIEFLTPSNFNPVPIYPERCVATSFPETDKPCNCYPSKGSQLPPEGGVGFTRGLLARCYLLAYFTRCECFEFLEKSLVVNIMRTVT